VSQTRVGLSLLEAWITLSALKLFMIRVSRQFGMFYRYAYCSALDHGLDYYGLSQWGCTAHQIWRSISDKSSQVIQPHDEIIFISLHILSMQLSSLTLRTLGNFYAEKLTFSERSIMSFVECFPSGVFSRVSFLK
jgi:hypothetical protein